MPNSNKRIIITCLVIVFVCICLAAVAAAGIAWYAYQNGSQLLTGQSCAGLPNPNPIPDVTEQMDLIEQQVSGLRGLQANSPVTRGFLTSEELNQKVLSEFFKDFTPEDEQAAVQVLSILGLLDKNFDLKQFYIDLYSEQIAGFYDQETKEMYVIQASGFAGSERMTYAHEFTHVLQDQVYDIQNGLNIKDDICETDSERCAAVTALLEGDASLTEEHWFGTFATKQDCQDVTNFYLTFKSPVFSSAPAYMQQDFIFPYVQGKDFVKYLYDKGGEASVDAAYLDTPRSTEQILHPEKYPGDQPQEVSLPDILNLLGSDWSEIDHGQIGEWYNYLILAYGLMPEARIDDAEAKTAAAGWGGDAYSVFYNQAADQTVMVVKTVWDSTQDAEEFKQSFVQYANLRFGTEASPNNPQWDSAQGLHSFRQNGQVTYWILAADEGQFNNIVQLLESAHDN